MPKHHALHTSKVSNLWVCSRLFWLLYLSYSNIDQIDVYFTTYIPLNDDFQKRDIPSDPQMEWNCTSKKSFASNGHFNLYSCQDTKQWVRPVFFPI